MEIRFNRCLCSQHDSKGDVKLAKITPLASAGTSVLHYFGSGAEEVSIGGWIFSESNKATVEGYRDNGTTISLTSEQGNEGNFKINDLELKKYGPFVRLSLTGYNPTTTSIYKLQAATCPMLPESSECSRTVASSARS